MYIEPLYTGSREWASSRRPVSELETGLYRAREYSTQLIMRKSRGWLSAAAAAAATTASPALSTIFLSLLSLSLAFSAIFAERSEGSCLSYFCSLCSSRPFDSSSWRERRRFWISPRAADDVFYIHIRGILYYIYCSQSLSLSMSRVISGYLIMARVRSRISDKSSSIQLFSLKSIISSRT